MIKSNKGLVETDGTGSEIITDIVCLLVSFTKAVADKSKGTLSHGEAFALTIMNISLAGNQAIQDLHNGEV